MYPFSIWTGELFDTAISLLDVLGHGIQALPNLGVISEIELCKHDADRCHQLLGHNKQNLKVWTGRPVVAWSLG